MTWEKANLVTKSNSKGMYDEWHCTECGYKQKYYSLFRDTECPKCLKKQVKTGEVYGAWSVKDSKHIICKHCKAECVVVPKEGHPNSKYWPLQRYDGEVLVACPNGCDELSGEFIQRIIQRVRS